MEEKNKLNAWFEWRRKCAIADCDDESKEQIREFIMPIIIGELKQKYVHLASLSQSRNTLPHEGCHIFESYMHATSSKTGKRWKDWLFEKAQRAGDVLELRLAEIEKQVRNSCKSALRNLAVKEGPYRRDSEGKTKTEVFDTLQPEEIDSTLFKMFGPDASCFGLGPDNETAEAEFKKIASSEAKINFLRISRRQKIAFGAKWAGISLASEKATRLADCSKSALDLALKEASRDFVMFLQAKYGSDNQAQELYQLQSWALRHLGILCQQEFFSGNADKI